MEHKEAVGKALFRGAGSHSGDLAIRGREEQRIEKELRNNGYPTRRIAKMKKKAQERNNEKEKKNNRYRRITIPYVNGLSEEIRREMKRFEIPVSFRAYKTIGQHLGHHKDPVLKEEQSGVIYKIRCKECDGEYIGETGRQLNVRTKEHQADVKYGRTQRSALAEHSVATGHEIAWEDVKIIETEQNWLRRKTKESWNIKMTKPLLNGTLEELYEIVIEDRRGRIKGRTPSKGMYDEKHQKKKGTKGK